MEEIYKKLISIGIFPIMLLILIGEQVLAFAFDCSLEDLRRAGLALGLFSLIELYSGSE